MTTCAPPVNGGEGTRIIHDAIATRAFFVTADSIYFIKAVAAAAYFVNRTVPDAIEVYGFRTGQTRTLARIANPWLCECRSRWQFASILRRSRGTTAPAGRAFQ